MYKIEFNALSLVSQYVRRKTIIFNVPQLFFQSPKIREIPQAVECTAWRLRER